jgi:2,4-dienoyl-CoA reductase-like NADH-dependent reductase (Old Yellow Enzyme family)/thioredoxin reductase
LRHKTLRNRIVFGAHTANMAVDGLPVERHRGYYEERARGGAAMIVIEPVPVHATGVLTRGNFRHDDDSIIPHFRKVTDAVHDHGAVVLHQLYNVGQHGDWDNSFEASPSPSGLPSYHDSHGSQRMSEAQIEEHISAFVAAAVRAKACGFDGVELFAAYNALIDQFWTPFNNRRDDRWGGSIENRTRFSYEIFTRIRKAVGEDFIVGLAVSMQTTPGPGLTVEQLQEVVAWHDQRQLMDYVTCGVGSYFDFSEIIPTFAYADKLGAPYAEALRSVLKHAKMQAEGHIRTPENADYVIRSGQADMVSIVRGQIADPHLANKAREGRPEDIRPCISCNRMCWGRRYRDYWISCLVNPSAGREFEWGGDRFAPAPQPKRILVVGGGPAGLEAARVAAERGHRLAGMQPRRQQIIDLLGWYESQLAKLQAKVQLNTYLEADEIAGFGADEVIIATGSQPSPDGFQRGLPGQTTLPGIDQPNVFSAADVMSRAANPGKRVIVLDDEGNWKGCGTAWHLAEKGHEVTLIAAQDMIGAEIKRTSADLPLRRTLKKLGVRMITESGLKAWHGDGATVVDFLDGSERRIDADALVLATTNVPERTLFDTLAGSGVMLHCIGDSVAAREANVAIFEARRLALNI